MKVRLGSVDSTNAHCARLLKEGPVAHGSLYYAIEQSAGKGQPGNKWVSEPGSNLVFSMVVYPDKLEPARAFLLNQWVSVALVDFLHEYFHIDMDCLAVKWPNDVLADDRKIAGILIESAIQGSRLAHAIAGVGLNLNQQAFPEELSRAVSVRHLTGVIHPLEEALDACAAILDREWKVFQDDPTSLTENYRSMLYGKGLWRDFMIEGRRTSGRIEGVDDEGRLVLQFNDESRRAFRFQELKWIW